MKVKVDGLIFCVDNDAELWRASTLLTKEEGTIRWLQNLRPGDVFYDIGANIGCYTLYAARLVGPSGKVYAFEPHVGNAHKLMMNVEANGFRDRVTVVTVALWSCSGFGVFKYRSQLPGSSDNQLGEVRFDPDAVEFKYHTVVDSFIPYSGPPTMLKMDVDGAEATILRGMGECFKSLRSIQAEVNSNSREEVYGIMAERGYRMVERHHTMGGKVKLGNGVPEDQITHNVVFER